MEDSFSARMRARRRSLRSGDISGSGANSAHFVQRGPRPSVVLGMLVCLASTAGIQVRADLAKPATGRADRKAAIRLMPLETLSPADRRKAEHILDDYSLYRRMPVQVVGCEPDMYVYLLRHPEIVVNIWQLMGVSKVSLQRTGPDTYYASDGSGTLSDIEVLYSDHDTHLLYGTGTYEGPLFKRRLVGEFLLLVSADYVRETNGAYYTRVRLDAFVRLPHVGVELVAKTVQPLMGRVADFNFQETVAFIGTLSHMVETNPQGIERLTKKLNQVEPQVRDQFVRLAWDVSRRRQAQASALVPGDRRGLVHRRSEPLIQQVRQAGATLHGAR